LVPSPTTAADRLHAALSKTFEGLFSAVDDASFERRIGHVRLLFPSVPIRIFNGVLVESEPCSGVADSIREVEERGLSCGLQLRVERHPQVEEEAARLGFTEREPMPGMAATPGELVDVRAPDLEIARADDEEALLEAARLAATVWGTRLERVRPLFAPRILEIPGMSVYVGRVDREAVTTAIGYRTDKEVALFNVATLPKRRRQGYGASISAHAVRAGFEDGADLAWLQTSPIGEPVYRRLGFRHVEMHVLLHRR
jgi:ribosomal protein S18 acetylase RimI-like enzyme